MHARRFAMPKANNNCIICQHLPTFATACGRLFWVVLGCLSPLLVTLRVEDEPAGKKRFKKKCDKLAPERLKPTPVNGFVLPAGSQNLPTLA